MDINELVNETKRMNNNLEKLQRTMEVIIIGGVITVLVFKFLLSRRYSIYAN